MLEIQKTSAKSEPDYALAVENEIHNKIREAAEGRDGAAEMAGFLARINQAAPISAGRLATTLSRMPGTSGLDVLDHLAQTPTLANSGVVDSTLGELARQAGGDSPEAVKHWLELHPSSPLAPTIRQLLELAPAN